MCLNVLDPSSFARPPAARTEQTKAEQTGTNREAADCKGCKASEAQHAAHLKLLRLPNPSDFGGRLSESTISYAGLE